MKKILPLLIFAFGLLVPGLVHAQLDFTMSDTVRFTTINTPVYNPINNTTTGNITLRWKVDTTDFPSDWLADTALGICDNHLCYGNNAGALWNSTTASGTTYISSPYSPGLGSFDYAPNLSGASGGTHYINVTLGDLSGSKTVTFIITRGAAPSAVNNISNSGSDVSLYPNPASDEVNIVYGENADIKNIAVYNIIGKVMAVYKVTSSSSANLNLENIPSGIYFVRLVNSHGQVTTTKKFTKQ